MNNLKNTIRDVPDFPKEGIVFKDITPLLQNPTALHQTIDMIAKQWADKKIDVVAGIEARGFIFAAAVAYKLEAGLVIVRKPGKLPYKTNSITYGLEYGTDSLEVRQDAVQPGQHVLIVDDLLATGGTAAATIRLIEKLKGEVIGVAFLIELSFLKGREKIKDVPIHVLIDFSAE